VFHCFSSLSGPLPSLSLPILGDLSLNHNNFSGLLPQWDLPELLYLNLASLPLHTTIPADWWDRMPGLYIVDVSGCGLTGPIPDASQLRTFERIILTDNQLTGGLPTNISSAVYSVANNRLSGPVHVPLGFSALPARILILAHNDFSCPIRLAHLTTLQQLNLQDGGFVGCDFNDPTQVQLPTSLTALDVSFIGSTCATHQLFVFNFSNVRLVFRCVSLTVAFARSFLACPTVRSDLRRGVGADGAAHSPQPGVTARAVRIRRGCG
jgi:hypothetical protein